MNSQKYLWVALIAVGIIAIAGVYLAVENTPASTTAGSIEGITNYGNLGVKQLKIGQGCSSEFTYAGCTGTAVNKILQGTCNAVQYTPGSFAATSTTQQFYCPVAGVVAGDNVSVSLPAGAGANAFGAGSPYLGFILVSASASSTAGFIQFSISNQTGAATSSFTQATTSIAYKVTD